MTTGSQAVGQSGRQEFKSAHTRMSYFGAARRVFDLSLGEMLWSRRTIFMALVVGGPVILALIVKGVEMFGMSALRVNGQKVAGFGIFGRDDLDALPPLHRARAWRVLRNCVDGR
jgi:hypothetical protein